MSNRIVCLEHFRRHGIANWGIQLGIVYGGFDRLPKMVHLPGWLHRWCLRDAQRITRFLTAALHSTIPGLTDLPAPLISIHLALHRFLNCEVISNSNWMSITKVLPKSLIFQAPALGWLDHLWCWCRWITSALGDELTHRPTENDEHISFGELWWVVCMQLHSMFQTFTEILS